METWEKCYVDPMCGCAEQVDVNIAGRVEFQQDENGDGDAFTHYFGEDELVKKKNETVDGMTCTAFKLEQLERKQNRDPFHPLNPNGRTTLDAVSILNRSLHK